MRPGHTEEAATGTRRRPQHKYLLPKRTRRESWRKCRQLYDARELLRSHNQGTGEQWPVGPHPLFPVIRLNRSGSRRFGRRLAAEKTGWRAAPKRKREAIASRGIGVIMLVHRSIQAEPSGQDPSAVLAGRSGRHYVHVVVAVPGSVSDQFYRLASGLASTVLVGNRKGVVPKRLSQI